MPYTKGNKKQTIQSSKATRFEHMIVAQTASCVAIRWIYTFLVKTLLNSNPQARKANYYKSAQSYISRQSKVYLTLFFFLINVSKHTNQTNSPKCILVWRFRIINRTVNFIWPLQPLTFSRLSETSPLHSTSSKQNVSHMSHRIPRNSRNNKRKHK